MAKNTAAVKNDSALKQRWDRTVDYFRGVQSELKKVHWPDRKQLLAYTGVVLFAVTLMAIIIWMFDSALSYLLNYLMNVLR